MKTIRNLVLNDPCDSVLQSCRIARDVSDQVYTQCKHGLWMQIYNCVRNPVWNSVGSTVQIFVGVLSKTQTK